jgi:hypothetical protein
MKIKLVDVGPFRLPGVQIEPEELTEETVAEINQWCQQSKCGSQISAAVWSFRRAQQRDLFILKWSGDQ